MQNQQLQDPFVAVVIDPNRTTSVSKVDIGAFHTYPENYTPAGSAGGEYQSIPLTRLRISVSMRINTTRALMPLCTALRAFDSTCMLVRRCTWVAALQYCCELFRNG